MRDHTSASLIRGLATAAAMVAVSLALVGCTQNQTQVRSTGNADGSSETYEHVLEVPVEAERVELLVELDVASGSVAWTLVDPLGVVRDDGSVSADTREARQTFAPLPGAWRLDVTFEAMSGEYDFRLRARW